MVNKFPLPVKSNAFQDLQLDPSFLRIPQDKYEDIVETAWSRGQIEGQKFIDRYGRNCNFQEILHDSGILVKELDKDYTLGETRYFCEYISGKKEIHLYKKSIEIWAEKNLLPYDVSKNYILSHEYFHYLEWTVLGLTSKLYMVPMIEIGKLKIGKTGIRAMSEIAANAFVNTVFRLEENDNEF